MIPYLVPEIEGGYPERDGEEGEGAEEGLVLTYSRGWIVFLLLAKTSAFHNL